MKADASIDERFFVACARRAASAAEPRAKIEALLLYLEGFPLGAHNRVAAESLERLFDGRARDAEGLGLLWDRFRALRDRHLPPLAPH